MNVKSIDVFLKSKYCHVSLRLIFAIAPIAKYIIFYTRTIIACTIQMTSSKYRIEVKYNDEEKYQHGHYAVCYIYTCIYINFSNVLLYTIYKHLFVTILLVIIMALVIVHNVRQFIIQHACMYM